jgi:hypothetical protein
MLPGAHVVDKLGLKAVDTAPDGSEQIIAAWDDGRCCWIDAEHGQVSHAIEACRTA